MADTSSQDSKPLPSLPGSGNQKAADELPKLSAADFRAYNRLAVTMDAYHNRFRSMWNLVYKASEVNKRPSGMSIREFLNTGLQFCDHLEMHHTFEEQYIYPELAERASMFKHDGELLHQHEQIHDGLERMRDYLRTCKSGSRELRMSELKEVMDSYGSVLWQHLDEEVKMLGAENVRKYWTKEEIRAMPWSG